MPEEDKIEMALKEIGFCDELKVKVSNGRIVAICSQIIQRPSKHGIDTQHTIKNMITREGK